MIFEIAFILVAIGIFSTLWAITEILFLDKFLSDRAKLNRSKSVRNEFDKLFIISYIYYTFNNGGLYDSNHNRPMAL